MDGNFNTWLSVITKHFDNNAPVKTKRVKHKRVPECFIPEFTQMQKLRDKSKRLKQWADYKRYRHKTRQLIRSVKRKYFSESVENSKDTKFIWKHLQYVSNNEKVTSDNVPEN